MFPAVSEPITGNKTNNFTRRVLILIIFVNIKKIQKMGLPSGRTNNPSGRPSGAANKNSKQIREIISCVLSENIERIQEDIDSLEPKDRLAFMEKLLQYAIPRLQATSIHTIEPEPIEPKTRPDWLTVAI
jgi:hypothetical protein